MSMNRNATRLAVAMLVAYFFATNHYEKQLWLMLGTCVALSSVVRSSLVARRSSQAGLR